MSHYLAVYGTLKKDYGNHRILGEDAEFIGEGLTENKYTMLGMNWVPMVYKNPETAPISVEVYKVTDERLKGPIDRLEANGLLYNREKVNILSGEDVIKAWLYFSVTDSTKTTPPEPNFEGAYKWGYKGSN